MARLSSSSVLLSGLLLSAILLGHVSSESTGALRGGNSTTTRALAPAQCLDKATLDWTSSPNGAVLLNGKPFHIKGISWFGLEKGEEMLHGLNKRPMGDILDFVKSNFNVIRLPFSVKFALSDQRSKRPDPYIVGFGLEDLTSWEVLDKFMDECAERGLFVMLDQHDIVGDKAELWYEGVYTEEYSIKAWEVMFERYGNHYNMFAADLRNEPHGLASWGESSPLTDYNHYYERLINRLARKFPDWKGLWLVEGTQYNNEGYEPPVPQWWGGNLEGAKQWPIKLDTAAADARLVYAPHIYGPSVYEHGYMKEPDFPNNLPAIWEKMYGFIIPDLKKGVIIGEWGGSCIGKDQVVQYKLGEWLRQKCMANNVWWALNPGSDDTGGLLKPDWYTVDYVKMNLLDMVQPHPTRVQYVTKDQICMDWGAFSNPNCKP